MAVAPSGVVEMFIEGRGPPKLGETARATAASYRSLALGSTRAAAGHLGWVNPIYSRLSVTTLEKVHPRLKFLRQRGGALQTGLFPVAAG